MVDQHLQERFTRHCTDAAFGYATAATAAYAVFADQVLSFWADALQPSDRPSDRRGPQQRLAGRVDRARRVDDLD